MRVNGKEFEAEVVDSMWKCAKGLSGKDSGNMLFVLPPLVKPRFWMWRMKFPIWISFLEEDGTVFEARRAEPMQWSPKTWKVYKPQKACRHVLETEFEVKPGDRVEW